MKLIVLILGLVLGFGGGVWWGVQNPEQAKDLAAKEAEWMKKGKEEAFKQVQAKLEQITSSSAAPTPPGGRSFVGGTSGGGAAPTAELKDFVNQQLSELK